MNTFTPTVDIDSILSVIGDCDDESDVDILVREVMDSKKIFAMLVLADRLDSHRARAILDRVALLQRFGGGDYSKTAKIDGMSDRDKEEILVHLANTLDDPGDVGVVARAMLDLGGGVASGVLDLATSKGRDFAAMFSREVIAHASPTLVMWFAVEVPGADTSALQQVVIASGHADLMVRLASGANEGSVDLARLRQAVIDSGDVMRIVDFARDVADDAGLMQAVLDSGDDEAIRAYCDEVADLDVARKIVTRRRKQEYAAQRAASRAEIGSDWRASLTAALRHRTPKIDREARREERAAIKERCEMRRAAKALRR